MKIVVNAIECVWCNQVLVSDHTHDFKTCSCPHQTVSVDGGKEYLRRVGSDYIERSVIIPDASTDCGGMWLVYCPTGKTNPNTLFFDERDAKEAAMKMEDLLRKDTSLVGQFYVARIPRCV